MWRRWHYLPIDVIKEVVRGEMGKMKFVEITENFKDKEKLFQLNEEAFPVEERIPSAELIKVLKETGCDGWAAYDDDFIGFATILKGSGVAYLWFLAVRSDCQSKGYGSKILNFLGDMYAGYQIILDMEQLLPDAPNLEQRRKRLSFYLKNGYHRSGYGLNYFDLDFEVLYKGNDFKAKEFLLLLQRIKTKKFLPELYPLESIK